MSSSPSILLAGGHGYVGKHLLHALKAQKLPVRHFHGDLKDASFLKKQLAGIGTAFYLVKGSDSQSAKHFAHACAVNKVRKIIYLGRLGDSLGQRRRQKVGEILLASGVTVVEFRASVILGRGSLSFEIVRALVERWPIMILPRWVYTLAQPIAIDDMIAYLMEALQYRGRSRIFEVGGPEQVPYVELMNEYMRQRGLRRWKISVPAVLPRLSRRWLNYVAPQSARASKSLMADLCAPAVVTHPQALRVFRVRPRRYPEAIAQARLL